MHDKTISIFLSPDGNYALAMCYGSSSDKQIDKRLLLIRLEDKNSIEVTGFDFSQNQGCARGRGYAFSTYAPGIGWGGEYIFAATKEGVLYYTIEE